MTLPPLSRLFALFMTVLMVGCASPNTEYFRESDLSYEPAAVVSFAKSRAKEIGLRGDDAYLYGIGFCNSFRLAILEGFYESSEMRDEQMDPFCKGRFDGSKYAKMQASFHTLKDIGPETYGYAEQRVVGVYVSGFEVSKFVPDGSDEVWWLTSNNEFYEYLVETIGQKGVRNGPWAGGVSIPENQAVTVDIKGLVSPEKEAGYGHLNQYAREIIVQNVFHMARKPKTPDGDNDQVTGEN